MKVKISLLLCISALLTFTQCDKQFDTYYERPVWLEDPIYQELEARGNFTKYLQAVDRTLHAQVLKGAGLYTCFAPNDSAFQVWLTEKNYNSVADIPQQEVENLVAYSLVYGQYISDNLGSALIARAWMPGVAYKYKTTYYPMLSREIYNGDSVWVVDVNNQTGYTFNTKTNLMQNSKYLPVYTQNFFNASSPVITENDYLALYSGSNWCGTTGALGNVGPASIVGNQHLAENGIFYETDCVVEATPNMYNFLKNDAESSDFWSLLNFQMPNDGVLYYKTFREEAAITKQYQLIYPEKNIETVYIRGFGGLAVNPVAEQYAEEGTSSDVTQEGGYTLFVPNNNAVKEFMENKLLKYYTSLEQVPMPVLTAFINSQMVQSLTWPSYFTTKINATGEYLSGKAGTNQTLDSYGITEKKMLSNGIVYKTNNVIKSRWFESVYSEIFLNPRYSLLNQAYNSYFAGATALQEELMKCTLNGYENERNTLFLFDNAMLSEDGFAWDAVNLTFTHNLMTNANAAIRLKRLMKNHVFIGYKDSIAGSYFQGANLTPEVLASTSTVSTYNGWHFRVTNNGEMVRFKANTIQAVGDVDEGSLVTLTPVEVSSNGSVFTVNHLLKYSSRNTGVGDTAFMDKPLWYYLNKARTENPNVKQFVDLVELVMKTSTILPDLLGVKSGNFYTVLMPDNAAMNRAKAAQLYPTTINVESDPKGVDKALRFLQSHFLVGQVLVDDNLPIIYPFSPLSDDPTSKVTSTLLAITSDRLELINEKPQVVAYKYRAAPTATTYSLRFYAKDIKRGNTLLVQGAPALSAGPNNHLQVIRAKLGTFSESKSNRMACRAVLHEVNNYLNFVDK